MPGRPATLTRLEEHREQQQPGRPDRCDLARISPCAVCGEPATRRRYDGLDPNEQHDPHTGRSYSRDLAHYQAVCAAHG
jgi:hypothetical protein